MFNTNASSARVSLHSGDRSASLKLAGQMCDLWYLCEHLLVSTLGSATPPNPHPQSSPRHLTDQIRTLSGADSSVSL